MCRSPQGLNTWQRHRIAKARRFGSAGDDYEHLRLINSTALRFALGTNHINIFTTSIAVKFELRCYAYRSFSLSPSRRILSSDRPTFGAASPDLYGINAASQGSTSPNLLSQVSIIFVLPRDSLTYRIERVCVRSDEGE